MRSQLVLSAALALALPAQAQQDPIFDAPLLVADSSSRLVKTLDLDGDGWMDAVGWWLVASSTYRTKGWINDGSGHLVERWMVDALYPAAGPIEPHDGTEVGDLDGDGDDDFVFSLWNDLRVYRSNGSAAPTLAITFPTSGVQGVALADFDLDGDLEIAFNNNGILEIRSPDFVQGILRPVSERETLYLSDGRLIAAELTGDGVPDLMVGGARIYPVVGSVILAPTVYGQVWAYDSGVSLRHDVGDVDGDGDLDVVTFRVSSYANDPAQYRVLRRTGPSSFVPEPAQLGGPARRLFDVDADGDLDGVCCGGGGSGPPANTSASSFRLAWNDGTGHFAASVNVPSVGSTAIAGVEDLDHDGDLDLVAGRCVFYAEHGPIQGSPFRPVGTRVQNEQTLCDYDLDGDPDVELSLTGVRVNLGDGNEAPRTHVLPPEIPGFPRVGKGAIGDWDGDGDFDLLVHLGTQAVPLGLELLRNVGCGSFESAGQVAVGAGFEGYPLASEDSLAVDVDGDGDLDLVRRTRSAYGTPIPHWLASSWWRNEGPTGFVFAYRFANEVVVAVADFDGDARPDVLAVPAFKPPGQSTYRLKLAFGTGGGSFGPWNLISGSGSRPYPPGDQVCVADLDLDGDLDLSSAVLYSDAGLAAHVHINDGTGHFSVPSTPYVDLTYGQYQSGGAAVTDLNRDGLVDLVFGAAKYAQGAAVIYLRKSSNDGWDAPILQALYSSIGTIGGVPTWNTWTTMRDPDGDRDVDLITNQRVENLLYALPDSGSRVQQQDGSAGLGAISPTLGAVGPFRVGSLDTLRLRGARPGAHATLSTHYLSTAPASFGGITASGRLAELESLIVSGSSADPAGSGHWSKTFTVPAHDAGRTKVYRVVVEDDSASGGLAMSNRLVLSFGP